MNQTAEILENAKEYMERRGFVKHTLAHKRGVCAMGAIRYGNNGIDVFAQGVYMPVKCLIDKVAWEMFPDRVEGWRVDTLGSMVQVNDHPDTTMADVISIFEKAIVRAQEMV